MKILRDLSKEQRSFLAIKKIKNECPPQSGEARFMFAVLESAIKDAYSNRITKKTSSKNKRFAKMYLKGDMPHAQLCGIDPQWVRDILRKLELPV